MKKTMKKALAIVLAIFMVVSTIPMVLATDDPSTIITDEAGLQTAFENGGEYTLGNNIIITDSVYHSNDVTTVIDMNGYEIGDIPWEVEVRAGDLTLYGGSIYNVFPSAYGGSLTLKDVSVTGSSSSLVQNSGGKLILENTNITGAYSNCIYAYSGETVIVGGTYSCGTTDDAEIISYYDTIPDVKIYGGIFSKSVAEYVADGYTEVEKDGEFVVESNMKGTAGEGITWIIDYFGTLTISGTGAMDTDWYSPPWKEYNDLIINVVVEEGVTEVSDTAFEGAENLVTVSLPSTLTYISGWAFFKNYSLEEINIAETNTTYKSIDGILFTEDEKTLVAYPMNKACEEYTIPASVTTIGENVFPQCGAVDKVIVPDTVTTLGELAFAYSQIKTVEIGNGVTEIPRQCFFYSNVEKVIISDSVETITQYAFSSTNYLNTLIIGSGVETIDKQVLNNTFELTTIHYKGTQETWNAISIAEDNAYLNEDELHFISGDVKEGTEPTCADGHTAGYYCDECDAYLTGEAIPAVDEHTPGEAVEENIVSPNCTTAGSKDVVTYCTVCGEESSRETVETEALAHDWNNGVCGACGDTCTHIDNDFDEICDECEAEVPMEEAMLYETNTVYIEEANEAVMVKFTPSETGKYLIYSDNGGNDGEIDPYVEIYNSNGDEIEEDDDHDGSYNFYCDFEAEAGETYYIELYAYQSDVEYDYIIKRYVEISHQPTTDEPYVELNFNFDADYQWYSVVDNSVEITDENADALNYDWGTSSYNAETGWSGVSDGFDGNGQDFFTVSLEAGDTVTVELTGDYYDGVGLWDYDARDGVWVDLTEATSYELTAEWDGDYTFYTYQEEDDATVYVKAYIVDREYTPIDGETDSIYAPTEEGLYACEVTFADGTKEMSDIFEGPHIHDDSDDDTYCDGCDELLDPSVECDHNCHEGGIAGFFWKIARFFNKLFGLNKYCECGVAHY